MDHKKDRLKKDKHAAKTSTLKERLHKIFGYFLAGVAVLLVIVVFGGAYYFVVAPNLISKPFIEKPALPGDALERIGRGEQVIGVEHINYLINEIGAYKLKSPFRRSSSYPIMEFAITDLGKRYYSYVKGHIPITKEGNAKNEDVVIKGSQETAYGIFVSGNIPAAVKDAKNLGAVNVELTADMKTLAEKGYLSLYDTLK